jgi:hypothetical protein
MIARGEITEIVGRPSSGRTSLLLDCLRDATQRGAVTALVDADETFDPTAAARAGVDLRRVLWVRCGKRRDRALRAADLLVRCPGFAVVALDLGERPPRLPLTLAFRLRLAVRRSGCALLILASRRITGAGATLAVQTVRQALEWSGPRGAPTRLARVGTTMRVLRCHSRLRHAVVPETTRWWMA